MSTLNLIGNGFDLYHGLPCNYTYFADFLIDNHSDLYDKMGEMYDFSIREYNPFFEEGTYIIEDLFWREFEERLGKLNSLWLEGSLMDDLGLEYPDDPVDLDIPETINAEEIKSCFDEWICDRVENPISMEILKRNIGKNLLKLSKEDYYVNFNYTSLLNTIYGIGESKIFHIHGKANEDYLIVGHGNKEAIDEYKQLTTQMEKEVSYLSSQADRNRYNEYNAELLVLEELWKDTNTLISRLEKKIKNKSFDIINVFGLSCGPVDLPYIQFLNEKYPNANWRFSYFDVNERKRREELAKQIGIKADFFEFKNPNSETIKKKIVDALHINEYKIKK